MHFCSYHKRAVFGGIGFFSFNTCSLSFSSHSSLPPLPPSLPHFSLFSSVSLSLSLPFLSSLLLFYSLTSSLPPSRTSLPFPWSVSLYFSILSSFSSIPLPPPSLSPPSLQPSSTISLLNQKGKNSSTNSLTTCRRKVGECSSIEKCEIISQCGHY